jgi:hypothetical protein
MGGFSRSAPPSAVASCPKACIDAKAKDEVLIHGARERAGVVMARGQTGSICAQEAAKVGPVAARMERYEAALPGARAARDLNELGNNAGGPVNQPCLTRLPTDAAGANKALGIDPNSPNALTERDLRNNKTGYRSALYRDETNGKVILVSRDTQPDSVVDWKTNIDNGQGRDTKQYEAVRGLSTKLAASGTNFDIAGYSKGGGLAQEAGLVSPDSNVYVFNSAGLHPASLARTGQTNFDSLVSRTHAFSAQQDFLTYMNNTSDPAAQLTNARFLRDQLAGEASWGAPSAALGKMAVTHLDPTDVGNPSAAFAPARAGLLKDLDQMIANRSVAFPPVRAATKETIPNSLGMIGRVTGANNAGPNLGKLAQHQISNVVGTTGHPGPMENQIAADRATLQQFRAHCG